MKRSATCTKVEALQRRAELQALLLLSLPADELAKFIDSQKPPHVSDLIRLAQRRSRNSGGKCPHCGKPLLIEAPRFEKKVEELAAL